MKKKILLLMMSALIACSAVPAYGANLTCTFDNFEDVNTYADGQFKDVKSTDWFADSVKKAYEMDLVKGTSDTTFNPTGDLTLAEGIVLACRLHSIYYGDEADFTTNGNWFDGYYRYAANQQLIKIDDEIYSIGEKEGYTNSKITREMFAVLMARALPKNTYESINALTLALIPDQADIKYQAAKSEILRLYNSGIMTGSDEYGTFNPQSNIKRSEVAAIVTRVADPDLRKTFIVKVK